MKKWLALSLIPLVSLTGFLACDDSTQVSAPPDGGSPDSGSPDAGNAFRSLANPPAPVPTAVGRGGAAATVDVRATLAAIEILKLGGNAIDASVAAAAVLGVTDPFSCGIGGGGFMVIYLAKENRFVTVDHREKAPKAQTASLFYAEGKRIDTNEIIASGLSVGVPGTVRGWDEALRRYGKKSLGEVLQPGIFVAENGFVVDTTFVDQTKRNQARFQRVSSARKLYLTDAGEPRAVGDLFKNPDLGATYRKIAEGGTRVFYEGEVGQKIVDAVRQPPEANPPLRPGVMTMEDLANYDARVRLPVESTYRGHTVVGMPAPSSGGMTLAETLNILTPYTETGDRELHLHRYIEASRLAYADRNAFHGDPEYTDVPLQGLLSPAFAQTRRALITDTAATGSAKAGDPYAHQSDPSPGRPPVQPPALDTSPGGATRETTHLTVTDSEGNIVSYTFTIEFEGGSSIVVPGLGFILNNELTDFDIPTDPNAKAANILEPGKRPRSSMTPTLIFKDGKPRVALGSPGGSTIITTVGQTVINYLDFNMPIAEALASPRVSERNIVVTPGTDTKSTAEPAFINSDIGTKLKARGHQFVEMAEIGAATGIQFNEDGTLTAVAEPVRRGGGSAMVVTP
ncbi:gamma-glutamyltransferase [Pendulispora rubella]|uniref:Glutathione hydrolase proenzyme n=1 Tax=Pendulispora rubella TaxID=2741070 RepID=A0ABZ2LL36_9BACT